MEFFPTGQTLAIIAGIGGWAGVWHAATLAQKHEPVTLDRLCRIATLPLLWSSASVIGNVIGIATVKYCGVVFASMFHPVPFIINILAMCAVMIGLSIFGAVRKAFRTAAETVAEELAVDAAIAAARAQAESDSESEAGEQEAETDNESEAGEQEAGSDTDSTSSEASEVSEHDADEQHEGAPESQNVGEEIAPAVTDASQPLPESPLTAGAVSVTPPRPSSPAEPVEAGEPVGV